MIWRNAAPRDYPCAQQNPAGPAYGEFAKGFPDAAVEYLRVILRLLSTRSAYVARPDTFIERNPRLTSRLTDAPLRDARAAGDDVIIIASVSRIYGIGSVETYGAMTKI
jgi:excinuclease ABC subunit B